MDECSSVTKFQNCHVKLHVTSVGKASQLQEFEIPSSYNSQYMELLRFTALRTGRI